MKLIGKIHQKFWRTDPAYETGDLFKL